MEQPPLVAKSVAACAARLMWTSSGQLSDSVSMTRNPRRGAAEFLAQIVGAGWRRVNDPRAQGVVLPKG